MRTTYNFNEVAAAIEDLPPETNQICLQVGTNDIRQQGADECIHEWTKIIRMLQCQAPDAHVTIGTIPPMRNRALNNIVHKVNLEVQHAFRDDPFIIFVDNGNLWFTSEGANVFAQDGYHFKKAGFLRLVKNLKRGIHNHNRPTHRA